MSRETIGSISFYSYKKFSLVMIEQKKLPKKVYFYCLPENFKDRRFFPHQMICLAEGLIQIDIKVFSNVNYWQLLPNQEKYLFTFDPNVKPDDCSIVVISHEWFHPGNKNLPSNFFSPNRKYITVYLHSLDENLISRTILSRSEIKQFDFVFKAHFSSKMHYPDNYYSLPFGISNRILEQTNILPSFQSRKKQLIVNFRHTRWTHSVRKIVKEKFNPFVKDILLINDSTNSFNSYPTTSYDLLRWYQTGKRHYPDYYNLLKNSAACSCFGGWFVPNFLNQPNSFLTRICIWLYIRLGLKSQNIMQWDSWRFWESLAAGCATFHLDFDKYGIFLPIMPENWKHYIGVDLDNVSKTIKRLKDEPEILQKVAIEGRKWALEHYSPVATARLFLKIVSEQLPKNYI